MRWLIWPGVHEVVDPREHHLAEQGIRVVQYRQHDGTFTFQIGRRPDGASSAAH